MRVGITSIFSDHPFQIDVGNRVTFAHVGEQLAAGFQDALLFKIGNKVFVHNLCELGDVQMLLVVSSHCALREDEDFLDVSNRGGF